MAYVDARLQGKPVPAVSVAKMEGDHTARLDRVKGSDIAFLDQKIPAYRREIINIIGMGVTENVKDPDLAAKIKRRLMVSLSPMCGRPMGAGRRCIATRPRRSF